MEPTQVHCLLRRFGWNSTSFQVLGDGFNYWPELATSGEACIAYVDIGGFYVVAGPPIAERVDWPVLVQSFVTYANQLKRRVCFFGVEKEFVDETGLTALCIGEQAVWDPSRWQVQPHGRRSFTQQLRRARNHQVQIRAVAAAEAADPGGLLRAPIEALCKRWLATRPMAPLVFLVQVAPFTWASHRLYFLAEVDGRIVGCLVAVPVYARNGWLFETLLRDPGAANGTMELLVDAAMQAIAARGSRYATLGMTPLSGPVLPWLRAARWAGRGLYDFRGLYAFKAKMKPSAWHPIYLALPNGQSSSLALLAVLRAFVGGSLVAFAGRSLLRGSKFVLRLLAAALIPWTLCLALLRTDTWFPAPSIHAFWIIFDVLLCAGLFALSRRWHDGLATLLAGLVTADTCLTGLQVVLYPVPAGWVGALGRAVAVAAPALAATVLWGARRRQRIALGTRICP